MRLLLCDACSFTTVAQQKMLYAKSTDRMYQDVLLEIVVSHVRVKVFLYGIHSASNLVVSILVGIHSGRYSFWHASTCQRSPAIKGVTTKFTVRW